MASMPNPSPRTHLYRLGFVLIVAFVGFVGIVALAAPASWNYEIVNWYRTDALEELKAQPMVYGGIEDMSTSKRNEACQSCHKEATKTLRKQKHRTLSCESCHGALFDHVREGKKIADAMIDRSTWQCLNCHEGFINKPDNFRQFRLTEEFKKHRDFKAGEFAPGTTCLKCHDGHDPTP
jgi:hypothetical protein